MAHKHNSLASMKPKILLLKCGFCFEIITFTIFHQPLDLVWFFVSKVIFGFKQTSVYLYVMEIYFHYSFLSI